jgi:5-methylcytosine-specific restriction endonuclease McrA
MAEPAYKRWYKTARWQRLRRAFLAAHPLCVMCEAAGRTEPATVCDHIERHAGDEVKFWAGPWQALCKHCHDSAKQRMEKSGRPVVTFGVDGWPVAVVDGPAAAAR